MKMMIMRILKFLKNKTMKIKIKLIIIIIQMEENYLQKIWNLINYCKKIYHTGIIKNQKKLKVKYFIII